MDDMSIIWVLGSIFILLVLSAFFSCSETGLTAVSRAKMQSMKREGNKRAKLVSDLRDDADRLIGTLLLGNNLVNIAASALATALAISLLGDEGVVYATIVVTLVVLIFAEVLPKTYALNNPDKVALFVSPVLWLLVRVFHPLTWLVRFFVRGVLKVLGIKEIGEVVSDTHALRGAIELHHAAGVVVKDDRYMLDSILDLDENDVADVMVHRKDMETINLRLSPQKVIKKVLDSKYSRLPLWEGEPDNIVGILHVKDLLALLVEKNYADVVATDIRGLLHQAWYVPETTTLKEQLNAFLSRKNHFALVVDEYGDLHGLLTLEDILEEIVGQIEDEHDEPQEEQGKINRELTKRGSVLVDGRATIRDLNREMDWDLPDDKASTVAGLLMYEAMTIPAVGQKFQYHGYRFEVLEKHKNQILKIRVSKQRVKE